MFKDARWQDPEGTSIAVHVDGVPHVLNAIPGLILFDELLRRDVAVAPYRPTADDVRAEARRRMILLSGARSPDHLDLIIANATREAVRLLRIKDVRSWTEDEALRAGDLEALDRAIEAIRIVSNTMEADPPEDYRADERWPPAAAPTPAGT